MICFPGNKGKKVLWPCGTASRKGHGLETLGSRTEYGLDANSRKELYPENLWKPFGKALENLPFLGFC